MASSTEASGIVWKTLWVLSVSEVTRLHKESADMKEAADAT